MSKPGPFALTWASRPCPRAAARSGTLSEVLLWSLDRSASRRQWGVTSKARIEEQNLMDGQPSGRGTGTRPITTGLGMLPERLTLPSLGAGAVT